MKIKVGEKYRVRSLESLKREFGLEKADLPGEAILCYVPFVRNMYKYCGRIITIAYVYTWEPNVFDIKEDYGIFAWSTDMIMPIGGLREAIQNRRCSSNSSVG